MYALSSDTSQIYLPYVQNLYVVWLHAYASRKQLLNSCLHSKWPGIY